MQVRYQLRQRPLWRNDVSSPTPDIGRVCVVVGGVTRRQEISATVLVVVTPPWYDTNTSSVGHCEPSSRVSRRSVRVSIEEEVGDMCERLTDVRKAFAAYARILEPACLSPTQAEAVLSEVTAIGHIAGTVKAL